MRKLILFLALLSTAALAQNSLTLYEGDGTTQTAAVITLGRVFASGEIATCAQPIIGGSALDTSHYQVDVRTRWPNGSLQFAVITLITDLTSHQGKAVTFQNTATCNNSGFLDKAGIAAFNGGSWDASMELTANGTTVATSAKTMAAALSFADCQMDYTLQGPLVTQVRVQDCTSASSFDFGWHLTGGTMASPTGSSHTASTASIHPEFILTFIPSKNIVGVQYIVENDWAGRAQNQIYSLTLKAGAALSTVYGPTSLTHVWGQRFPKQYWSGTAPGRIFIDHNLAYLTSTKMFPPYDPAVTASTATSDGSNYATSYTAWAAGSDHGDLGQFGGIAAISNSFGDNGEGAPLQREELLYLYNMGSCGSAGSECAKARNMLTGFVGADSGLTGFSGGAGVWNNNGNIPYHVRESRTAATGLQSSGTNFFYCPPMADKDAVGNATSCAGGSGVATGRPLSRHAHSNATSNAGSPPVVAVGDISNGTWDLGQCDHWQDWAYTPYLLTGNVFYQEEELFAASFCNNNVNDGNAPYQSNGHFAFSNTLFWISRNWAWALQTTARAALIAPDGSVEKTYYTAIRNSNIEVLEGAANIVGTTLTPTTSQNTFGSGSFTYNNTTANRWDFGRYAVYSQCPSGTCAPMVPTLHGFEIGNCPVNSEASGGDPLFLEPTVSGSETKPWMENYALIALSELTRRGVAEAGPLGTSLGQRLEEFVGDSNFNPWLALGAYTLPIGNASGTCTSNVFSGTMISSYAVLKTGWKTTYRTIGTFDVVSPAIGNHACADHGYSTVARAAASYLQAAATSSSDASCPGGVCTAAATWTWVNTHTPYFNNTPTASTGCGAGWDRQIKYALTPDSPATATFSTQWNGVTLKGVIF